MRPHFSHFSFPLRGACCENIHVKPRWGFPVNLPNFFAELQRRHVYKVGAAYAVAGWLIVQIVTQVFPIFEVSALAQRIIVLLIVAGFPFTLILTWLFDITARGVVRTGEVPATGENPVVRRDRLGTDRKM